MTQEELQAIADRCWRALQRKFGKGKIKTAKLEECGLWHRHVGFWPEDTSKAIRELVRDAYALDLRCLQPFREEEQPRNASTLIALSRRRKIVRAVAQHQPTDDRMRLDLGIRGY